MRVKPRNPGSLGSVPRREGDAERERSTNAQGGRVRECTVGKEAREDEGTRERQGRRNSYAPEVAEGGGKKEGSRVGTSLLHHCVALAALVVRPNRSRRPNGRKKERYHADSVTLSSSSSRSFSAGVSPARVRSGTLRGGPRRSSRSPPLACVVHGALPSPLCLRRAPSLSLSFFYSFPCRSLTLTSLGPFYVALPSLHPSALLPPSFFLPGVVDMRANCTLQLLSRQRPCFLSILLAPSRCPSLPPLSLFSLDPSSSLVLSPPRWGLNSSYVHVRTYIRVYIGQCKAQVHRSAVGKSLTLPRI